MDLKVDVFEKKSQEHLQLQVVVYLQNFYIKYLRIWISYWGWERERIKRECWVKLANENFMDPEFRSSSNYIV